MHIISIVNVKNRIPREVTTKLVQRSKDANISAVNLMDTFFYGLSAFLYFLSSLLTLLGA